MKSKIFAAGFAALAFNAAHVAIASPLPLKIETRYSPQTIPSSCTGIVAKAEEKYRENWKFGFDDPVDWVQVDLEHELRVREEEKRNGNVTARFLAPVGSQVVFLMQPSGYGTYASMFVNCETSQAYISLRGGYVDHDRWTGPYDLRASAD